LNWISRPEPKFYRPGNIEYHRLAVDAFEILGPVAKPAIPGLMKNVEKGSYSSMRALEFIGKDAVPALTNKLLQTLADKRRPVMNWRDPRYKKNFFHVQALIVSGLGEMGTNAEAAIPALKLALYANHGWLHGVNPHSTMVSVGQNRPDLVIPALLDALTNQAAPAINRGAVATAISTYGTNHVDILLPPLIKVINDKRTDSPNRRTIAGALAVVGRGHPELVIPVLTNAFVAAPVEYQDGIAIALAMFGREAQPALPLLRNASRSPYFHLRQQATIAVKTIAPETADALVPLIKDLSNREAGLRQQAIYSLGRLGTNAVEAIPALLACLSNPDTQTRIDATRALNDIGVTSDDYIIALGENLTCTNHFTAGEAKATLGKLARHSKLAFVTLLKSGLSGLVNREVRSQSKYARINVSRANPQFMLECLDDEDPRVRSAALIVFYDLARSVPAAIPKIRQLAASDPDSDVRSRAGDVLRLQLQY
jgi:HEAT repeat protein